MAKQNTAPKRNTLAIARETFKQLAVRRIEPSPDNYERIFHELNGSSAPENFEAVLNDALSQLNAQSAAQISWVNSWQKCLKEEGWASLPQTLENGMDMSIQASQIWPDAIQMLLNSWAKKQQGLTSQQKSDALDKVLKNFGSDAQLPEKIQGLAKHWESYQAVGSVDAIEVLEAQTTPSHSDTVLPNTESSEPNVTADASERQDNGVFNKTPDPFQQSFNELKEVLRQSIKYGFIPRLDGYPDLQARAQEVYKLADKAKKLNQWQEMIKAFRALIVKVEFIGANESGVKNDLVRMLKLLLDNVGQLVDDDAWLRGQVSAIQTVISGPIERAALTEAEQSLKEVVYKQGLLKHSLDESKETFKQMIATFVDRLGQMTDQTGNYATVIGDVSKKLSQSDDLVSINQAVETLMQASNPMQTDLTRSRDDLLSQSEQVQQAQAKIEALETELSSLSEQVRVDQLTGVLNRRGMDEAFATEIARADRSDTPLSIALLDIDNFKQLNDNYGHDVGDDALKHLAEVVKSTVRPTDVVTRFGGEEFVILLPDTALEQASKSLKRLQRELTKAFFMANQAQLVITFSAGAALYRKGEAAADLLHRADQAMYLAKRTGKNKAMTEEDLPAHSSDAV